MHPLLACYCLGTTCVNHCCPSWKVVCHCKVTELLQSVNAIDGSLRVWASRRHFPASACTEVCKCPSCQQSRHLVCSRNRFHGRSSGVTRSTDVLADGGGAELDVAAAWSKGPLPKAEPLPELVRGRCGHGWPPGRACPPLGNSPSPSCQPSTSLLYTHCLTVPHWAAFKALPIISSRESISASSSPSERRRGLLAFSGPMPRHNRWRTVLNFVPSALAAQPSTESARDAVFFLAGASRPPNQAPGRGA